MDAGVGVDWGRIKVLEGVAREREREGESKSTTVRNS